MLIRLYGCTGWSAPLLFAYGMSCFRMTWPYDENKIYFSQTHHKFIHYWNRIFEVSGWHMSAAVRKWPFMADHLWAMSWENLFLPYANNKGTYQPVHPCSLVSAFVVRCLDSILPLVSISEMSSLCLVSVTAQAGLSTPWSETLKTGFLVMWLIYVLTRCHVSKPSSACCLPHLPHWFCCNKWKQLKELAKTGFKICRYL